ncbi:MAG: CinA family protein [Mediterranea massiliensis]|nr:CinA family protein [Mediterranea massiliensis]
MKALAEELGKLLLEKGLTLSTAESCTGGGIASIITAIPGSSQYFHGGIVAYANEVKMALLEVQSETLERHGAVSEQTVVEMAKGAMKSMKTTCSIATSGIAGPGGGTADKPVGTIWIAVACNERIVTKRLEGDFGRAENIKNTIKNAISLLIKTLK